MAKAAKRAAPRGAATGAFRAAKARQLQLLAREKGLLGQGRTRIVSVRVEESLLASAKREAGIASDTELVKAALAGLAVGDDFGEWLLTQEGRLDPDFRLEL